MTDCLGNDGRRASFILPDRWRRVRLVLVRPTGWIHASCVAEVTESLVHGFSALGSKADLAENQALAGAVNIFFHAFLLTEADAARLPPGSIIYNFEQAAGEIDFLTPSMRIALAGNRVWDYSGRNLARLAPVIEHDRRQIVPAGYVPVLSRIVPAAHQDIDVLFYGSVNERRYRILHEIDRSGLILRTAFGIYGAERDALIARAKLVLNIHAHPSKVLEIVRISYLLANRKAVVTELDDETEMPDDLREAVAGVPETRIVDECRRLIDHAAARHALEERGYRIFRQRDLVAILQQAVTEAAFD